MLSHVVPQRSRTAFDGSDTDVVGQTSCFAKSFAHREVGERSPTSDWVWDDFAKDRAK